MVKKSKIKINWQGNIGRCYPDPGTIKKVKCGVCSRQMNVKRNVLGPTSWAESMGGGKHRHDSFTCPNLKKGWHEKVVNLKLDASITESSKIKKILEEEIVELLEANAVR